MCAPDQEEELVCITMEGRLGLRWNQRASLLLSPSLLLCESHSDLTLSPPDLSHGFLKLLTSFSIVCCTSGQFLCMNQVKFPVGALFGVHFPTEETDPRGSRAAMCTFPCLFSAIPN